MTSFWCSPARMCRPWIGSSSNPGLFGTAAAATTSGRPPRIGAAPSPRTKPCILELPAGPPRLTIFQKGPASRASRFDSGAPAYTLGGNGITLAGNLVNSSANDQTITLPITLPGTGQVQMDTGAKHLTLGGSLSGSGGGITKTGAGTLTLGAISYTGDTIVESGTLVLTQAGLSRSSTVTIGTTAGANAVLDLSHGLTERVFGLSIDGVQMADGSYGSSSSAATHKDDTRIPRNGHAGCPKRPLSTDLHDPCGRPHRRHIQFRRQLARGPCRRALPMWKCWWSAAAAAVGTTVSRAVPVLAGCITARLMR